MVTEVAILGGGCFWCLEACYLELRGVVAVESGYCGGRPAAPTYEQVCGGDTGHAEVVRVEYDPAVISYEQVLEVFFAIHDPTTLNRQGHDIGTQYRSAIFWLDQRQRDSATELIARLERDRVFAQPVVTELAPGQDRDGSGAPGGHRYYPAEDYHQRYFDRHPGQGYCQVVVAPKLAAFRRRHRELLQR